MRQLWNFENVFYRRHSKVITAALVLAVLTIACGIQLSHLIAQSAPDVGGITHYEVRVQNREIVLFPFDSYAIPFRSGLELSLVGGHREENPVLRPGKAGRPDSGGVAFYGTVIPIQNQLRMWYLCAGGHEDAPGFSWLRHVRWRVCYATSTDGIHWEKPNLGLVEYGGNVQNNLVKLDPTGSEVSQSVVIYDPEDPNPDRRFKMLYENYGGIPNGQNSVAFSRDGLTWTNSPKNPVIKIPFEPSGLIKHDGFYYATGHGGGFTKRVLAVHASADFDHWTQAVSLGFRRDNVGPLHPRLWGGETGEQVHLGASLWDRGNVILGLYGQWHGPGPESNDRRDMRLDLGFVISHDALHYYEPIRDFKMIPAADQKFPALGFRPRLVQGQAFLNLGDQTLAYYSFWGPGGADGVRLATWPRDRLGYYSVPVVATEGQKPREGVTPHFISCPIWLTKPGTKIYINAAGLGEYSHVTVEILNDKFQPIPGFSGADSIPLTQSGLHEQISWQSKRSLGKFDYPIRLRVNLGGLQLERSRVYAVYLK